MARVLILSMGPVFPGGVHGGSQKILAAIACHLGELGNDVRILCTARPDLPTTFSLNTRVTVEAQLSFKQPFPDPFRVAPSRVAESLERISLAIADSDVVYMHDAAFCPVIACLERPLVVSIRDFLYSESIVGLFSFKRDILILNSDYAFDVVMGLLPSQRHELCEKVVVVPNGIDESIFFPVDQEEAKKSFGLSVDRNCLVFPHRTVSEKGGAFLIQTIQELERRGHIGLDVVMPIWMDAGCGMRKDSIAQLWRENGLQANLALVPWADQDRMRFLYSAADVTLCLGNAPEAFGGNVALESISCGTPVVATSVGAYRSTIPRDYFHQICFGLELDAADCVEAAMKGDKKPTEETIREIRVLFSFEKMLEGYERVICEASIGTPLGDRNGSGIKSDKFGQAPWCSLYPFGYYHDFDREYYPRDELHDFLVERNRETFASSDISCLGIPEETVIRAIERGLVICIPDDGLSQMRSSRRIF